MMKQTTQLAAMIASAQSHMILHFYRGVITAVPVVAVSVRVGVVTVSPEVNSGRLKVPDTEDPEESV
jgi:hypothetical protein